MLPESPKFLYASGRYEESRKVFQTINYVNGSPRTQ